MLANFSRGLSIASAKGTMMKDFLPHQGLNPINKAVFLGHMIMKLIQHRIGAEKSTDRDSYIYKRIGVTGILLHELFTDALTKFIKNLLTMVTQEFNYNKTIYSGSRFLTIIETNKERFFNKAFITQQFEKSVRGKWGVENMRQIDGAAQTLDRLSQLGTYSHLRRLTLENTTEIKLIPPRMLHTSSYGFICPCETPAGGPRIGIVKNLAITASVSSGVKPDSLEEYILNEFDVNVPSNIKPQQIHNTVAIFVNGTLIGYTSDPSTLISALRTKKYQGYIHPSVSISPMLYKQQIMIDTSPARLLRPLVRVEDGRALFDEL